MLLTAICINLVDAHITEEETEALIANNTTSLFVGNVSIFERQNLTKDILENQTNKMLMAIGLNLN